MSGLLASGNLRIDRKDATGASTGLLDVGNATKFEIQEESEVKERISTGTEDYGQVLDTVAIKKPAKISIEVNDLRADNLAMAFLGDVAVLNQGAGTGESETVTAKSGRFVQLAKGNLATANFKVEANDGVTASAWSSSNAYSVDDFVIPTVANDHYYKCTVAGTSDVSEPTWPTDGSTVVDGTATWLDMGVIEYTLSTDYQVNYRIGLLEVLANGGIADAETLKVTYDHNAISGYTISGSTTPTIKAELLLEGINMADGKAIIVRVDEATLTPGSGVDMLAAEFATLELSGTLKTLTGKTSPYTVEMRD